MGWGLAIATSTVLDIRGEKLSFSVYLPTGNTSRRAKRQAEQLEEFCRPDAVAPELRRWARPILSVSKRRRGYSRPRVEKG